MSSRSARLAAFVLAATGCSSVVRPDDGAGGGGAGTGSADTSTGTGASVGGAGAGGTDQPGGAGGAGGRASLSCDDAPPGTFFITVDLPDDSYTLIDGCARFPQFPFAIYTPGGGCGEGTPIAACGEDVPGGGDFYIFTGVGAVGSYEVMGQFGGRNLLGTLFVSTFGEVGGVVSGELDGVIINDPGGDEVSFHAELQLCRLPDLPPCP